MEPIYAGSRPKLLINVEGLTDKHLSDDEVSMTASFYVKGKRSTMEYSIDKIDMYPYYESEEQTETNTYLAYVETNDMPAGRLVCELYIKFIETIEGREEIYSEYIICDTGRDIAIL